MTAERRNRLWAISDKLSELAEEVSVLADAMPAGDEMLVLAEAHGMSAISLRLKVLRSHCPDVD